MPIVNSLNILEHMYQQNRWPSVIVLEGAKHVRQDILDVFIQLVFCQKKQRCGQCEQCLLIKENNHPDIHLVQPEQVGHVIKIEQIRDIIEVCFRTPLLADVQLIIIENADALNVNSANALLKVLEEPSLKTHFILLVENHQMLIPTIRSRAWVLHSPSSESIPDFNPQTIELVPLLMSFLQNDSSIADLLTYFEGRHLDESLLLLQFLSYQMLSKKTLDTENQAICDLAFMAVAPMETWWHFYDLIIKFRRQNRLQASLQTNLVLSRLFLILKGFYE